MSTPTHILMGIALARTAQGAGGVIDPSFPVYTAAIIASLIPDIDIFYYGITPIHDQKSLLHKPIFWTGILFLACILKPVIVLPFSYFDIAFIGIAIFLHFVFDTGNYAAGIQWLWPFSKTEYHFFPLSKRPPTVPRRIHAYLHSGAFLMELCLVSSLLLYLSLSYR